MKSSIKIVLKILLAILLLGCLLKMPYSYFILVRFAGLIIFGLLAWQEKVKTPNNFYFIIWIASAIIINPIFKISFSREYWNIIDVILAGILLLSIFLKDLRNKKHS